MWNGKRVVALSVAAAEILLAGCSSTDANHQTEFQAGESMVLIGETPARLAFVPDRSKPVDLRNTYRNGLTNTVHYQAGRDYVLDGLGEIRRTTHSRIPDFGTNILYGKEDFDHGKFPGYGNKPFFVYADYAHAESWQRPAALTYLGASCLPKTRKKLESGGHLKIVAFGDSITAGGEASEPGLIFWERWADSLRRKYPQATIETVNGATGGDTTVQGLERLKAKVLDQKPDLVLVGFGMNDHNGPAFGVPFQTFPVNLRKLVDQIRTNTSAEIVLFSTFPPNPKWHYGSHNMEAYANATEQVAREKNCAFADVYHYWMSIAERKKPEDMLANNINHPNDFGHWIYFEAFEGIGL